MPERHALRHPTAGFTLVEIAIVLVVIGLVVGGILVGRDLIRAAEIRSVISQIDKYNAAVNTFRTKYNALPGDMPASDAAAFGFAARPGGPGNGDGNGFIESAPFGAYMANGQSGETFYFWIDLSSANLMDGSFTSTTLAIPPAVGFAELAKLYPQSKLGNSSFVVAMTGPTSTFGTDEHNELEITGLIDVDGSTGGTVINATLTPSDAYAIDGKIDDGLPDTGKVRAGGGGLLGIVDVLGCVLDAANTGYYISDPTWRDSPYCALVFLAEF
jgi:hypothetical protein